MNNLRLLAWLIIVLLSDGLCAYGQNIVSLEDIFATAETNSNQLRPSFATELEAQREISIAKTNLLPDINTTLSVSYIGNGFTTKRNYSDYQVAPIPHLGTGLSLTVSQPIYSGGAISNGIKLAEMKMTAARYVTDLSRDNLRIQLTGFYLDIYKYHNLREVVTNNIMAAQAILAEMRARYEQGTVLWNDITRYELLLSNLDLQLVKINNTLAILNTNLVTLSGMSEGSIIIPDTTILHRSLPVYGEDWWQQEATCNSPSLQLARTDVQICRQVERLVKADRLPKIGINAGWTMDGPILVEVPPINRNLSYWYVGLGISYNISSLYKNNKALSKSLATSAKALDQLQVANENTTLAVRSDYIKYMEAYEELKQQQKSVELATRNYNTTATRYSEGMALITDMLDATNARLDAEQQLVNARINIIYYYYKLLFTTGTI